MMRNLKISLLALVVLVVGIVCADNVRVFASAPLALHAAPSVADFSASLDVKAPVTGTVQVFLPMIARAPVDVRWNFAVVDREYTSVGNIRFSSDMVLDSNGVPHVAYDVGDGGSMLRYGYLSGDQWIIEDVGSTELGAAVSLALSSDDVAHISYNACNPWYCAPRYAEQIGAGWVITEAVDGQGALAIDSQGNPHLSYTHGNVVGGVTVRYAYRMGGNWITTTVAGPADDYRGTTLKLDTSGLAHMTYSEYTQSPDLYNSSDVTGSLYYTQWSGTAWIIEMIDDDIVDEASGSHQIGQNSALALGVNGSVHIGYYDGDEHSLKYAFRSGSGWVKETVDSVALATPWTVQYVALALDADDQPHLVYFDQGSVKYARRIAGQWKLETLATDVGDYSELSIAIGAQNRLHVTYGRYDGQESFLMYGWGEF
ncbi:MAG: hypothetical protein JXA21_05410 [Anaerolineae bacterium]|nr:hypothetical protein [Anaerolineae bacterium]